jgi:hypothetical protein
MYRDVQPPTESTEPGGRVKVACPAYELLILNKTGARAGASMCGSEAV